VAFLSLLGQLVLCQFFSFGQFVPMTIDINPSNLWKLAYHFPPNGSFLVLNWLGVANPPLALNPVTLASLWPAWLFFTSYAPLIATLSLLAMAAFLRELELPRPAALFGGLIYAWQGDLLPFIFPGHFSYITSWPFFALAAWGALRAQRTGHWAYALISGACCGTMVELPTATDRGAIASLLIAALYLAPILRRPPLCDVWTNLRHLILCAGTALLISLASFMALFQGQIVGVKIGGQTHYEQTYKMCTQFSLGPQETLTYLIPGFFGWHSNSDEGPYWGWIGQWPGWSLHHQGMRNFNLAISTTGTAATVLALMGVCALLPGSLLGSAQITDRSRFFGRVLLALGTITLVLSWGYHTPLYRPLFALPLMDKWRNPLKWLEMTNFALVTLSAFGVQALISSLSSDAPDSKVIRHRLAWLSGGTLVFLVLGLLAYYIFYPVLLQHLRNDTYDLGAIANITDTLKTSLRVAIEVMALFCLLLYGIWRPEWLRKWTLINPLLHRMWQSILQPNHLPLTLALGMAALSVAQLAWVDTQFIQKVSLGAITATNPLLEALKQEGDQVRVSVAVEDPILNILLLNQFNTDNISCIDISAASRIPDDINAFFNTLGGDKQRLWFLAGVKNIAVPQEFMPQFRNDPLLAANIDYANGYTLVPTGSPDLPSHALIGMKDYLAKVTLVPKAEVIPSEDALLKRLADRAWNPRETILLSAPSPEPPKSAGNVVVGKLGTAQVDLKTYTPTEIEIEVKNAPGGYVLINDQYDPDWQAQVNGHDVPLLRADFIMRAIAVPPGNSTITMSYVSHYHVAGFNLAARAVNLFSDTIMLAAWLIAGYALLRRKSST